MYCIIKRFLLHLRNLRPHPAPQEVEELLLGSSFSDCEQRATESCLGFSHLAHDLGQFNASIESQPNHAALDGVSRCPRSVTPHRRSTYKGQLHGIPDEDSAEATEHAPFASVVTVRGSARNGLPAPNAHEAKQILSDHRYFVDEYVVDTLEIALADLSRFQI